VADRTAQVAACQWLGAEAVQGSLLDKMPDAMRKDVEKAVAATPDRPKPPRCTRKEAAKRAAKAAAAPAAAAVSMPTEYPEGGLPAVAAAEEPEDDDDDVRCAAAHNERSFSLSCPHLSSFEVDPFVV
jgi:hypothetical protein